MRKILTKPFLSFSDLEDGFTLSEAIITFLIIGIVTTSCIGISSQIFKMMDDTFFNAECKNILVAVHRERDNALMSGKSRWIMFTKDSLYYYDPVENNNLNTKRIYLSYTHVQSDMPEADFIGRKIYFSVMGTTETGATFKLTSHSGRSRYFIIQPVTGRIYLTP